ncbi:MAG: hypothetical protein RR734_04425 [Bacilli bacterium]
MLINLKNSNLLKKKTIKCDDGSLYYYDFFKNLAYHIPKEKTGILKILEERYILGIIICIVLIGFKIPIGYSIIAGILISAFLSIYRRRFFFVPMNIIKDSYENLIKIYTVNKLQTPSTTIGNILISLIILSFVTINGFYQNYLITNPAAFVISIITIIITIIILIKQIIFLKK